MSKADTALARYRDEIDRIDAQLLQLLNARATAALAIGRIKMAEGLPIHVPEREEQVINTLSERNQGPLHGEMIAAIYRSIMAQMKELEARVKED